MIEISPYAIGVQIAAKDYHVRSLESFEVMMVIVIKISNTLTPNIYRNYLDF